jgi:hypothetical protein
VQGAGLPCPLLTQGVLTPRLWPGGRLAEQRAARPRAFYTGYALVKTKDLTTNERESNMTLPGETVGTGADDPGTPLQVCWSAAGHYIGYLDHDGSPYSRESVRYWAIHHDAATALATGNWAARTGHWDPLDPPF